MALYRDRILPHLIRLVMRNHHLVPYRARVLAAAAGRALEVGIGAGANLPFYGPQAREVIGLEPAPRLVEMARRAAKHSLLPVKVIEAPAENIPLDDNSIDTVVMTWTLCSIPDAAGGLSEMRRVLKRGGRLLFVEHGLAPENRVQKWQHRLTPFSKHVCGGCHLDRAISSLIENAGFRFERLNCGYMRGPKPIAFIYEGSALSS